MCISFVSYEISGEIKFALIFNRDEFFNRETSTMGFNSTDEKYKNKLFYPLDVLSNGTFLCINIDNGNFCCLLNNNFIENPYNSSKTSKRGNISIDFCKLDNTISDYDSFFKILKETKDEYNGYNLLCGNMKTGPIYYFTNNSTDYEDVDLPIVLNPKHIVGVSNYFLYNKIDKVEHGKQLVEEVLQSYSNKDDIVINLFKIMENNKKFMNIDLVKDNYEANILINKELKHYVSSSIYINDNVLDKYIEYGTRHTICLVMDKDNRLEIFEYFDEIIQNESCLTLKKRDINGRDNFKIYEFTI